MLLQMRAASAVILSLTLIATTGQAADQSVTGAGNQAAQRLAGRSPFITSAFALITQRLPRINDPALRSATFDATTNPGTCVAHRARMTEANKATILQDLFVEGLIDPADEPKIPGGLKAGVFPPLLDDSGICPHLPQPFASAPGSGFGGHHSYPGGLAVHVSFNLSSNISLAENYRRIYGGTAPSGLAEVADAASLIKGSAIPIDDDIIIAAPVWHDWAKTMVFQWNEDGTEFTELDIGGNGKTDNYGVLGTSKTGGHHIIGVAETMARKLPPAFVVTQASAHGSPTSGNEFQVVNWIRAASIIARIDPVAGGYLTKDARGRLRLPVLRKQGTIDLQAGLPNQTNLLVEYVLHNLSDRDAAFTNPAVSQAQQLAPKFGYDPSQTAVYNTKYRNPVLTYLSAERLQIIYANSGLDGVAKEIANLRAMGLI
jgi:hypothetical protein